MEMTNSEGNYFLPIRITFYICKPGGVRRNISHTYILILIGPEKNHGSIVSLQRGLIGLDECACDEGKLTGHDSNQQKGQMTSWEVYSC